MIGLGYSEMIGKLNHSCKPNSLVEFSLNTATLYAISDINTGDEVHYFIIYTYAYGNVFYIMFADFR